MTVLFRSVILVYITPCDGEEDFGVRRLDITSLQLPWGVHG